MIINELHSRLTAKDWRRVVGGANIEDGTSRDLENYLCCKKLKFYLHVRDRFDEERVILNF